MNESFFIQVYWKKQTQLFSQYFSQLKKYPSTRAVKEIRTSIKKLRAARRLFHLITSIDISGHTLEKTEQFFSILGSQRDVEVSLEIQKIFENEGQKELIEFKRYGRSLLTISRSWTKNAVIRYTPKEITEFGALLQKSTVHDSDMDLQDSLLRIIYAGLLDCEQYLKQPHELRKHLKEVYYWMKMSVGILSEKDIPLQQVKTILNLFGEWRNLGVYRTRLKHFRKDYLPKPLEEYATIKSFQPILDQRIEKLLKEALKEMRTLLKKVKSGNKKP